ncbi:LysR family transcriptional regulator [Martelella alba]|uniref:LysR family transcriptional regulator n=1 Tax=Martelella alba TaxID=2590451 RepID=A0A506U4D0_9HYPH|nr:LysR family transcriptional regulator [Martelella alba]TPW27875.1 LysR family transcriptional regulator [Martelella alba]
MDDPSLMRLFVAIAERGSLSAVSRAWGVAPSTVTLGLKQLEERIGTQLINRTTRSMALTPEGERFLQECRRVLTDLDTLMGSFSEDGPLSGTIRMTATMDLGRQRIAPLIETFMRRHPDVNVQLYLSDSVVDLVDAGLDLGLRTGPLQSSDLRARLIVRGHKCVCAAPAYWARHGKPALPEDLAGHNCMVFATPGETQTSWQFGNKGKRFRVRIHGDRTANDGQVLKDWAIAGAGVVLKSTFDIALDLAAGRLEAALEPFTTEATNLYAVFPPRQRQPRWLEAFLDHLSEGLSAGLPSK